MNETAINTDKPMWDWFELTYASYLVLPRALLCGMPVEWQERMVALLEEMRETYEPGACRDDYIVTLRQEGVFIRDPWRDYRRPPPLPYRKLLSGSVDGK